MENKKNSTTEILNKLLSDSRKNLLEAGIIKSEELGCCVYPDINNPGETFCGDNWSQAMCDYAGGNFYPDDLCENH